MNSGKEVDKEYVSEIIRKFSTAMLRDDSSCKTALCNIGGRFVRISIVYAQKAVVFTDPPTNKQIIKFYG